MSQPKKRKEGPGGPRGGPKKSKGGNAGRWQTQHQKDVKAEKIEMGTTMALGDQGIWVTYARGMGSKAKWEFRKLCAEYGESMYGIKSFGEDQDKGDDGKDGQGEEELDIEASIQQELASFQDKKNQKPTTRQAFTFVKIDLECVFFVKTMEPVDPREFVRKVCLDARSCSSPGDRKLRYINRLTPVVDTDRAVDGNIVKVARSVMKPYFRLKAEEKEGDEGEKAEKAEKAETEKDGEEENAGPYTTYAIRPTLRHVTQLKSMDIIKSIAETVHPEHKVNLSNPGKVVLVEVFQKFCSVGVVDGEEYERLRRYNVNEIYRLAFEDEEKNGTTSNESRVKGKSEDQSAKPEAQE